MSDLARLRRETSADGVDADGIDLRAGSLQLRLARDAGDIAAVQALRYRVFYEEMGAHPTSEMARDKRDFDPFDDLCDHVMVLDRARDGAVVGTYRLIRRHAAAAAGGFDGASEGAANDVVIAGLDPKLREILNQPIEMIELSSRASNCLKVARIRTIGELVGKRDEELLAVKNFGKKSLDEIKDRLKDMGLSLGMQVGQAA